MALVKVYFSKVDGRAGDTGRAIGRMGTLDALAEARLKPLMDTERVLDEKHLDDSGFWTPQAIATDDES